ncbi:hypothetical protein VZQ01_26350 [Myxococcus faecalis]|uniref:hypothetical protein n=1 Tax=Myxococcus faecalis TaxID=3115646 RepID=UPI003CF74B0B
MSWNRGIRQTHRWLSIAFTLVVIANIVVLGLEAPPVWVAYLALPPLLLLLLTGLYLFVLPYASRSRGSTQRSD